MISTETKIAAKRTGGRIGCGTLVIVVFLIFFGTIAYLLRPRFAAIWQAATGPMPSGKSASGSTPGERKILYWTCSMHPRYRSDKPGKCPECSMDLTPVYEESSSAGQAQAGDRNPGPASAPESAFRITPEKQQLIGVQYGEVELLPLSQTIRAVGRLAYDETRITRVHSKTSGWIEKIYVDYTGELVRKNQPLLSVYSPELLATQEEYLLALRARDQLGASSFKEVAAGTGSLLSAARKRLELWDITEAQIAELEKTRKPARAVDLYSTANGFVIARNAYEKQRIAPETELYALADLSTIWVMADVYEFEATQVHIGQSMQMTLAAFPGRTFYGKVTYIYPQVDNATRTLKVRAEFPNPNYALKPDMYADVELRVDYGKRPSVPQEAVLDSGSEKIVFVALDGGYFEPRHVQLGDKVGTRFVVLGGLRAGERIVTSGNFLIDSESRMKSALNDMGMPGMDHGGNGGGQPRPPSTSPPQPVDHSKHNPGPEPHTHD